MPWTSRRLLLETGWKCAERADGPAGAGKRTSGRAVGVYVGTWPSEYAERVREDQLLQFVGVGTQPALRGRVSYSLV